MVKDAPVPAPESAHPGNEPRLDSDPDVAASAEAATWPTTSLPPAARSVRDGIRARPFGNAELSGVHAVRRRFRCCFPN